MLLLLLVDVELFGGSVSLLVSEGLVVGLNPLYTVDGMDGIEMVGVGILVLVLVDLYRVGGVY